MKKTLCLLLSAMICVSCFSQEKKISTPESKDTTIRVVMNVNQFRQLLYTIDQLVDSKKAAKELLEFLQKSAQIMQPSDKPKEGKKN